MLELFLLSLASWLVCFSLDRGTNTPYKNRGGGGTNIEAPAAPPAPPSPGQTASEAIQAQIDALPNILAAQQQFGPQFTQQQLDSLNQFGPQFAQSALGLEQQFGPQLAQATLASQNILDPSRGAGSQAIADFIQQGPDELTESEQRQIIQDARGAASSRGLAESGFSAVDEVARLFNARQALKSRYLNVALSASGRLPAAGGQTVSANPLSVGGQQVQNVTPNNIFGAQASNNQFASSIFNTQGQIFGQQLSNQQPGIFGQIVGGLAGSAVGGLGGGLGVGLAGKILK